MSIKKSSKGMLWVLSFWGACFAFLPLIFGDLFKGSMDTKGAPGHNRAGDMGRGEPLELPDTLPCEGVEFIIIKIQPGVQAHTPMRLNLYGHEKSHLVCQRPRGKGALKVSYMFCKKNRGLLVFLHPDAHDYEPLCLGLGPRMHIMVQGPVMVLKARDLKDASLAFAAGVAFFQCQGQIRHMSLQAGVVPYGSVQGLQGAFQGSVGLGHLSLQWDQGDCAPITPAPITPPAKGLLLNAPGIGRKVFSGHKRLMRPALSLNGGWVSLSFSAPKQWQIRQRMGRGLEGFALAFDNVRAMLSPLWAGEVAQGHVGGLQDLSPKEKALIKSLLAKEFEMIQALRGRTISRKSPHGEESLGDAMVSLGHGTSKGVFSAAPTPLMSEGVPSLKGLEGGGKGNPRNEKGNEKGGEKGNPYKEKPGKRRRKSTHFDKHFSKRTVFYVKMNNFLGNGAYCASHQDISGDVTPLKAPLTCVGGKKPFQDAAQPEMKAKEK